MVSWSQQLVEVQEGVREWLPPAVRDLPAWTWLSGGAVVLASLWYLRRRRRRLPPGPMGLPWMGAVHCVGQEMHLDFMKLRKTYGDIFSLVLGGKLLVVLNGYPLLKEAFVTRGGDFADHPQMSVTTLIGFNDEIFASPYNDKWKTNRKFATMAFKRFGVGGSGLLEDKILMEVGHVMEYLRESSGNPVQLQRPIQNALARALTSFLYSEEYSKDDPADDRLVDLIKAWFTAVFHEKLEKANMFPPWLANILYKKHIQDAIAMNKKMVRYVQERIDEHRATLDASNLRDVIDVYLAEREDLDDEKLAYTMLIFLPDGVETLSSLILFAFLYITYYPEVQEKIQKELDAVVGRSGRPTMAHRKDLVYLQAAILETFRIALTAPLGAPHKSLEDTTLAGYEIPTNAVIMPNIYSVHMDPTTFPHPEKFDPHHFLDNSGQLINADHAIPFSLGRRMCLGEQISKMEIFLYLSNILHQFSLTFPPDQPEPSLNPNMVGTDIRTPKPFSVVAVPR